MYEDSRKGKERKTVSTALHNESYIILVLLYNTFIESNSAQKIPIFPSHYESFVVNLPECIVKGFHRGHRLNSCKKNDHPSALAGNAQRVCDISDITPTVSFLQLAAPPLDIIPYFQLLFLICRERDSSLRSISPTFPRCFCYPTSRESPELT